MDIEKSQSPKKPIGIFSQFTATEKPWLHVSGQMHDHAMTIGKIPAKKFYTDARVMVDTYAEVAAYYKMDDVYPNADNYNYEIEALGGKMVYGEDSMPTIDFRNPLLQEPLKLLELKTPDFFKDERLPYALNIIKYSKEYGANQGWFCAPFSMAVGMRSYPLLVRDMRKNKQFVHDLLTFIVDEVLVPYLKVQKEFCGISSSLGADAWCSVPNLSIREMNEWIVPYNTYLINKAKEFGMTVKCFSGDYCEESIDKFDVNTLYGAFDVQIASQGGIPSLIMYMGRWHDYPLQPVIDYTAKYRDQGIDVAIDASINARLLRDGPKDKIVNWVKHLINMLGRDHELSIAMANIPANTNPDHVHAAVSAVHTYGLKPITSDLDKIVFETPNRESFDTWKRERVLDIPK
jgi:uroporphyrinogen-III decarboxylase